MKIPPARYPSPLGRMQATPMDVEATTVRELQGEACISLDDAPSPKKQIACTRSFGQPVTEVKATLNKLRGGARFACIETPETRR